MPNRVLTVLLLAATLTAAAPDSDGPALDLRLLNL
jgi:hypothetical protein